MKGQQSGNWGRGAIAPSDAHLGTRHARSEALLGFLRDLECENPCLVGDFSDGSEFRPDAHWGESFNTVIQELLRKARKGTACHLRHR